MIAAMLIIGIGIAAGLVVLWATDRLLYEGLAHATWNNMHHASRNSRTVFVVVDSMRVPVENPILVAEVSLEAEAKIRRSLVAHPVQITIMQRMFGKPRITSLKA